MQPPDMLRIVRGRGWVDMNFNPQFSNAMAVDACGARVSPGQAARAARADDDSRVALALHCVIPFNLCTQCSNSASKQLQSKQRLIKPLRSLDTSGPRLNCHSCAPVYCVDSDTFSGFAFRCRKWFRIQMPKVVSDGATTKQTDGRGRNLCAVHRHEYRVRRFIRSSGPHRPALLPKKCTR